MNNKICVLLSTYNGEKFIREQLDSVLNQEGVFVKILVRDDGSSDNTIGILNEYTNKDNRISYYKGENIGPCNSFFDLLRKADKEYDFYAFCDQDDYWDKDKLIKALIKLSVLDQSKPALYCSNLKVVNDKLEFSHLCFSQPIDDKNRYLALVEFYAVGCTEVFNRNAVDLVINHLSNSCLMHDSWVHLFCNFFGNVVYDNEAHILYRQHSNNVIGNRTSRLKIIKDRYLRLFNKSMQPRLQSSTAFLKETSCFLSFEDRKMIECVVLYKQNLKNRIRLLFNFKIRGNNIIRDLRYRALIVLGKI